MVAGILSRRLLFGRKTLTDIIMFPSSSFPPLLRSAANPTAAVEIRSFSPCSGPDWSIRPPGAEEKELVKGLDFKQWLIAVEKPESNFTRTERVNLYVGTLAKVVGSEEEARKRIYSVYTGEGCAFGAILDDELYKKMKGLPEVCAILPDAYSDAENKDYGGEALECECDQPGSSGQTNRS